MAQMTSEIIEAGHGGTLATREDYMPVMSVDRMLVRYQDTVAFCKKLMVDGRDYGTIPGTERKGKDGELSSKNNTLLKPGAEKLCTFFGLTPDFQDYRVVEDWAAGLFYYAFKCVITNRSGVVVATGIGSCNSREKKYSQLARRCPECNATALKRSKFPPRDKPKATPGWYCDGGKGGCGLNFDADDDRIMGQEVTVDVGAAADKINTIQKMAQKRAMIAAVLTATNASEFFTQDMEDLDPDDGHGGKAAAEAQEKAQAKADWEAKQKAREAERAADEKERPALVAAVRTLAEKVYGAEVEERIAAVMKNVSDQAGAGQEMSLEECPVKVLRSWKAALAKDPTAAPAGAASPGAKPPVKSIDAPTPPAGQAKAAAGAAGPRGAKERQAAAKDSILKMAAIEAIEKLTVDLYADRADDMVSETVAAWADEHHQPFCSLSDCPTKGLEEWVELLKAAIAKKAK